MLDNFDEFIAPSKQVSVKSFLAGEFSDIESHFFFRNDNSTLNIKFLAKKEDDKFRLEVLQCLSFGKTDIKQGTMVFYSLEEKPEDSHYYFESNDFYSFNKYKVSVEKTDDLSESLYDFLMQLLPFIPVYKRDGITEMTSIEFSNFSSSPFIFNTELLGEHSLISLIEAYYA